jgi:hypothetical protein
VFLLLDPSRVMEVLNDEELMIVSLDEVQKEVYISPRHNMPLEKGNIGNNVLTEKVPCHQTPIQSILQASDENIQAKKPSSQAKSRLKLTLSQVLKGWQYTSEF